MCKIVTQGDMMISVFEIRLNAVNEHFREDHNPLRYKEELKSLAQDIGRHADESDIDLLHLYRTVKRELGFLSNGDKVMV